MEGLGFLRGVSGGCRGVPGSGRSRDALCGGSEQAPVCCHGAYGGGSASRARDGACGSAPGGAQPAGRPRPHIVEGRRGFLPRHAAAHAVLLHRTGIRPVSADVHDNFHFRPLALARGL